MSEDRRRAAFHEAGHSVVATLQGREVLSVTLEETRLECSRIEAILAATGPLSPEDEEHCIEEIKVAVAGCAGEVVQFGQGHRKRAAYRFDFHNMRPVRRVLRDRAGHVVRSRDILQEVISILRQNEDAQFEIAKELLAIGSLTGAQVRSIVGPPTASGC